MNIVFYDSKCGLCQRSVLLLMKMDRKKKLFFAPLFGETYLKYVQHNRTVSDSVLLYTSDGLYEKSDVFIKIGHILGGPYLFFVLLKLLPKKIRDLFYDLIAGVRSTLSRKIIPFDQRFLK